MANIIMKLFVKLKLADLDIYNVSFFLTDILFISNDISVYFKSFPFCLIHLKDLFSVLKYI